MKTLQEQFAEISRAFKDATLTAMPSDTYQVRLPRVPLPPGWSAETTEILFVVPNGYPYAQPDCFWADTNLRLQTGGIPQNAQIGQPNAGQPDPNKLWFSWHLTTPWNPSTSDLMTWVKVIRKRFETLQ
ncbi:E2/UBC family protein [Caballeronia zhejiangensis]|uniref:E2/UBC family protein n=1 Tax=Caballeronia zhejiangensis TaxID=871203 RepID=UPI001EF626BA|nr:E2/UBC family protein [Caballeronia zhejiangensis]MCG7400386.1 hypothetical protein [Caballeronia zhejiangensis]